MSETVQKPPIGTGQERIPFWRDSRVLGVLLQIAFVSLFSLSAYFILANINENLDELGPAQFLCRDGSSQRRCALDFLSTDAQFDIAESVVDYVPDDSYWDAIRVGILNTAKAAGFGIILATILGTLTGIARLSANWLVSNIAKWYIEIIRNTPLLLQLFFLYFVFLLGLPGNEEAIQPFGLPIYFSQRGMNFPEIVFMSSWATWLAFIVLGIVQAQVLWIILGQREELTGRIVNRPRWAIISFLIVISIGWVVAGSVSKNEAILVARAARVRDMDDLGDLVTRRLGIDGLNELELELNSGGITQADVDAAALTICAIRESESEVNFTSQLRSRGIPYSSPNRSDRPDQAIAAYAEGVCEIFVAPTATLAAERDLLETSDLQLIVGIPEAPARIDVPVLEGFNFVGGSKLTTEFTAILVALVLFTAAYIAEIVRAGIMAVSKGQSEAARALGLSEGQRLRLIVLPQALRVIIPPLTSQYLNLTKNSSLALAVAYPDLFQVINTIINQSGRSIQPILLMAIVYLSFSIAISLFLNWYNARIALVER